MKRQGWWGIAVWCAVAVAASGFFALSAFAKPPAGQSSCGGLTYEQRVEAQEAIERVFDAHRIWPKENPGPKPALEEVMSRRDIEAKVRTCIERSDAFEASRGYALSAAEMEAELARMKARSRDPRMLDELFSALSNDPLLLEECLARPALVERGPLAEQPPVKFDQSESIGPTPENIDDWTATSTTGAPQARGYHTAVWTGTEMIVWGGDTNDTPYILNTGGRYTPATDSWTATSVGTNCPSARASHTAIWTGTVMVIWGGQGGSGALNDGGRYTPGTDSWAAISTTGAPAARSNHTAVWTGTKMIVWGGAGSSLFNTGGVYDPSANTWSTVTTTGAPQARFYHTAVWTGSVMIVWGGAASGNVGLNDGGRYNLSANTWAATSTGTNCPHARYLHQAVWTGSRMIVWGGQYDQTPELVFNDGASYDPSSDAWATIATSGAPGQRTYFQAIWTGSEMIVWGGNYMAAGCAFCDREDGGRYNPATDSWLPTSMVNVPTQRSFSTSVWAGTEMIVWGGWWVDQYTSQHFLSTGGRWDDCTAPGAPTLTSATGTCAAVNLAWSAVAGTNTTYNVYRYAGACGGSYAKIAGPLATPSYSDTSAVGGTAYAYVVTASCSSDGKTESGYSNCLPGTRIFTPAAPTGVTATGTCSGVTVSWNSSTGATSYNVYRGTVCGTTVTTFTNVTSPYSDNTAVLGTTYQYWVAALNGACQSANSSCSAGAKLTVPSAPTGVGAANGCSGPTISWNSVSGATSYNVLRGSLCGTVAATFTNVTSPYQDTTGAPSTTYSYWVVAVNACGNSANSSCIAAQKTSLPAPTGVSATTTNCTYVLVTWSAVTGASSYTLYRGTTCGTVITTFNGAGSPYYDYSAVGGTTYQYWVVANNGCGAGLASSCAAGALSTPPAPAAPTFANIACHSLTVNWSAVSGAVSYDVYRATGSVCGGGGFSKITFPSVAGTSYTDNSVQGSTTYSYYVTSNNGSGCASPAGGCATVATLSGPPITTPTNLAASATCGGINVTWDAVANAQYYLVMIGSACGTWASSASAMTNSFLDVDAVEGTTYYYAVAAATSCSQTPYSSCVSATGVARFSPPPGAPSFSNITCNSVTLDWSPVSGADSYDVYRSYGPSCTNQTKVNTTPVTATTYSDTRLYPSMQYSYSVIARSGACASMRGACGTVTTSAGTPPSAPTNVSASGSCSGVTVSWDSVPGALGYDVYRGTSCGSPTVAFQNVTSPYLDSTAEAGTPYNYVVIAWNCGNSVFSSCASGTATTGVSAPSAPGVSDVSACALSGVSISWGDVSGATGYDLQVDGATVVPGVTNPYVYSPGDSSSHAYKVRATASGCTGAWSSATSGTDATGSAPPQVTGPVSPADGDTMVCTLAPTLSWNAATGATGYTVVVEGNPVPTCQNIGGTSCSLSGLSNGVTYHWSVRSIGPCGTTDGPGWTFTTNSGPIPMDIQDDLRGVKGAATANFDWSLMGAPGPKSTHFNVYRTTAVGGAFPATWQLVSQNGLSEKNFDDPVLNDGLLYFYDVRSADDCGNICASILAGAASSDSPSCDGSGVVHFTSSPSDGTPPYTYDWDFGDGSAHSTNANPMHTYSPPPNTYTATLIITDSTVIAGGPTGQQVTVSLQVGVGPGTLADSPTQDGPKAVGVPVNFTSSPTGGVGPYTFSWDFGDGSAMSTAQNPSHAYAAAGGYAASVTVTDSIGCHMTTPLSVTIE